MKFVCNFFFLDLSYCWSSKLPLTRFLHTYVHASIPTYKILLFLTSLLHIILNKKIYLFVHIMFSKCWIILFTDFATMFLHEMNYYCYSFEFPVHIFAPNVVFTHWIWCITRIVKDAFASQHWYYRSHYFVGCRERGQAAYPTWRSGCRWWISRKY